MEFNQSTTSPYTTSTCIQVSRAHVYSVTCTCIQCHMHMYTVSRAHVYSVTCTCIQCHMHMYTVSHAHVYSVTCTCIQCHMYMYSVRLAFPQKSGDSRTTLQPILYLFSVFIQTLERVNNKLLYIVVI